MLSDHRYVLIQVSVKKPAAKVKEIKIWKISSEGINSIKTSFDCSGILACDNINNAIEQYDKTTKASS